MCKIATKKYKNIDVSSIDIKNRTNGSTLELAKLIKKKYPLLDFYFLIGLDNANNTEKWHNYEYLLKAVKFVIVRRKGYEEDVNVKWYKKYPHIFLSDCSIIETCSSDV